MILLLNHVRADGEVDTYHLKAGRRYHIGRGSTCEVRILDLKLSRRHCAIEFREDGWYALDQSSTNGCRLDGDQIVGATRLAPRSQIEMGGTILQVYRILDGDEEAPEDASGLRTALDGGGISGLRPSAPAVAPGEPTATLPERRMRDSGEIAAAAMRDSGLTPQPQSEAKHRTDAITSFRDPETKKTEVPASRPPARVRTPAPESAPPQIGGSALERPPVASAPAETTTQVPSPSTMPVVATAALAPRRPVVAAAPEGDRSFFINLLGVRIGPLTRVQARELKARELKGELTQADLAELPRG